MAKVAKRRGRWMLDYYDAGGKRRYKTMPAGATKTQANDELRAILDQIKRGTYLPEKRRPSISKIADDWLETKKQSVRANTYQQYAGHIENHIKPIIGPIRIDRLTTMGVEKFTAQRRGSGVSVPLSKKVLVTLAQIMRYAVKHRLIDHNPVTDADRPKDAGKVKGKSTKRYLTGEQINALIDAVSDPKFKMLIHLAAMTGARQGELIGLQWRDVDFKSGQINIRRSFNNRKWYQPKSAGSFRAVDVGQGTLKALKRWKVQCPPSELGLVFPNGAGDPLNHSNLLRQHFWPALEKAKLPRARFHDLRHSYASIMLTELGANVVYVSRQLGHADPSITLKVYSHILRPTNPEAAQKLENSIFGYSLVTAEKIGEKVSGLSI